MSGVDRSRGGRPGAPLPTLAALLLALIPGMAASQTVIEGEVTAKKDDRVHVTYTLPDEAAPLIGDEVDFGVTMRGLAVSAGRGQVVEVEDETLWARVDQGDPPFGAVARIQATGGREDVLDLRGEPSAGSPAARPADATDDPDAAWTRRWSELVRYEAESKMYCASTPDQTDPGVCQVAITLPAGLRSDDLDAGISWALRSPEPATGPPELACKINSLASMVAMAADRGVQTLADAFDRYYLTAGENAVVLELQGRARCLANRSHERFHGSDRVTYGAFCTDREDPLVSRVPSGALRVEPLFKVICSVPADRFDEATDGPGLLDALRSFEIGPP